MNLIHIYNLNLIPSYTSKVSIRKQQLNLLLINFLTFDSKKLNFIMYL